MIGGKLSVLSLSFVAATGLAQVTPRAAPGSPGAASAIAGESKCATLRKSYPLALFVKVLSGGSQVTCGHPNCSTELYLSENVEKKKCYVTYKNNEIVIPWTEKDAPDDCSKGKSRSKVKKLMWKLQPAPAERVFPGASSPSDISKYEFEARNGIELTSGNDTNCDLHDGGHDVEGRTTFRYKIKHFRTTDIQYCPHVLHAEFGECEAWDPFIFNQ